MAQRYLYLNSILYVVFAIWCTVAAKNTATQLGYLALSSGGRSEYLVIYGGLQVGLAILFFLLARNAAYFQLGLLVSIGVYAPILIYRLITVATNWPVSGLTLGTGALETILLIGAVGLYYSNAPLS